MNPLVADMLDLVSLGAIRCESPTHDYGRVKCSGDVAYVLLTFCHGITRRVCSAMGERAIEWQHQGEVCGDCGASLRDCWTIRPWG